MAKAGKFQRELWEFYTKTIEGLKPIDILVLNGDAIEGKGERSGGIELITTDRNQQVKMAQEVVDFAEAQTVRILYGTRYHVGKEEDFEAVLASTVKGSDVEVQGHAFLTINGCGVDIKHKVSSSTIPHGRMTAIARQRLWNVIWNSEHERQPLADVLIRSHVHYFQFCGGASWLGVISPALCYNTSYGIRECDGLLMWGLSIFDFKADGGYDGGRYWPSSTSLKVRPESL